MSITKVSDFKAVKLKLASPEEILNWSHGEVLRPETINYRTQKPEKDGLFCERIFGPTKDWECYCGKYRRIRYKGIVCDKCGVEVTRSIVRRERMGHIKLATPVSHIWFLRGIPSKIGLLLDMSVQNLERIIYFANYVVTEVDEKAREKALEQIQREYKMKIKKVKSETKGKKLKEQADLKSAREKARQELENLQPLQVLSEVQYRDLSLKYGQVFNAGIGAKALREILEKLDLKEMANKLAGGSSRRQPISSKDARRLRLIQGLIKAGIRPEWMILTVLPVLPPDLRPMVPLDGGRFATSDLNDLYRRVINRNNRLKRLMELRAPEVICRNEKRMLQEAVDALIDNSARRGQAVTASTGQKRLLRSLADMLRGKQGRFRQNLLGKRVDYSGRSVIMVGPELNLHQCGLPKKMALELFKPFVINKLIEGGYTHNVRSAGRLMEQETTEVYDILEEITSQKLVLLNRAPTLHRLGIQAFQPVLIEGKAIQVHPMVCRAFNADFDGDQMAVHLPLTKEAQKEAQEIMLSAKNLLKPATGEPIATPTQDIVLGCYWMTTIIDGLKGEGKVFGSLNEAILAYQFKEVNLRAKIKVRIKQEKRSELVETCIGRIILNQALPEGMEFINNRVDQKSFRSLVANILEKYGGEETALFLDRAKKIGFDYVTSSGISWGMDDLYILDEKKKLLKEADKQVELIRRQYENGLLTEEERRVQTIEIWTEVKNKISDLVQQSLNINNPVYCMVESGARGSWPVVTQMMGIKGLVVNPAGETIELPVRDSLKEGFNVLEYFISTHGARKGLADTALRTSTAGYLTRRLIDVAQDVIIREEDCKDKEGYIIYKEDGLEAGQSLASRIIGRTAQDDIKIPSKKSSKEETLVKAGEQIDKQKAELIEQNGFDKVKVRSVVTCKTRRGVCQKCYGYDLGLNKLVKIGEAVGIVTAQAIGEPGTQLTLRTFHTGGVAGGADITQGLPRVEEIFEARSPKGRAPISEVEGVVEDIYDNNEGQKVIKIKAKPSTLVKNGKKPLSRKARIKEYNIPSRVGLWVKKGDKVFKGQQLSGGHIDLQELFRVSFQKAVHRYIIREVQSIYSSQGEGINEKHIEVIIRQMFSRVRVKDPGDTDLLTGEIIERAQLEDANEEVKKGKGKPATVETILLGITKASLTTESFLSAASFQETARVLIDAAIKGKEDKLRGLKENVIIGKLIPAGTGYSDK